MVLFTVVLGGFLLAFLVYSTFPIWHVEKEVMEAMSIGLPCICSKIRGNVDLIDDGVGGYLFPPDDYDGFASAINKLAGDKKLRFEMGQANLEKVKAYSIENVKKQMKGIYSEIINNKYR